MIVDAVLAEVNISLRPLQPKPLSSGGTAMKNKFFSLQSQKGVTIIEYALIAALISVVAMTLLTEAGAQLQNIFQTILNALTDASSAGT